MEPTIRQYREDDAGAVVRLSLSAWAPVFDSMREVVGMEIFERLHGNDWRRYQQESVERVLADDAMHVWVAEADGAVTGFVAVVVHEDRRIGEIWMLAVAPEYQTHGLGTELTRMATDWIRDAGIPIAMVDTGGDPGPRPPHLREGGVHPHAKRQVLQGVVTLVGADPTRATRAFPQVRGPFSDLVTLSHPGVILSL